MFKQLLVRPDIPHMFLSDVNKLIGGIKYDFPDIVKLDEIGYSWEQRPINMMTIDVDGSSLPIAQGKKEEDEIKQKIRPAEEKPANATDETIQALE